MLWGVGAALAFPIGMSAAADDPKKAAARVSVVSTLGYIAFLAGPPLLGYLGDVTGIRTALLAIGIPILVALLLAGAAKPLARDREGAAARSRHAATHPPRPAVWCPMRTMLRKAPGRLSKFDRKLVRAVSNLPGGGHDDFFRRLSAAANKGKLWFGVAGAMALVPGKTRRAAVHGLIAQGVASAVTNVVFKTLLPRARPLPEHLPVFRFVNPQPTSSSMPSGHSASAVAFALGVGMVRPALGAALAPARGRSGLLPGPHRGPLALGCAVRVRDRRRRGHGDAEVVARPAAVPGNPPRTPSRPRNSRTARGSASRSTPSAGPTLTRLPTPCKKYSLRRI